MTNQHPDLNNLFDPLPSPEELDHPGPALTATVATPPPPRRDPTVQQAGTDEPPRGLSELHAVEPEEYKVFTHNGALERLWNIAVDKLTNPWGVLGVALAYTAVATEPTLRIPPLVGSDGSLNVLVGIVADSGGGKGASLGVVTSHMRFKQGLFSVTGLDPLPLGSGQGIAEVFKPPKPESAPKGQDAPPPPAARTRALFEATEIDGLAASRDMRGSTVMSVLRKAYSGENPGNMNASEDTTRNIAAHSYRTALVCGIQPKRSGALLNDGEIAGGTPQRWLWLDAAPYPISTRKADPQLLDAFSVALPDVVASEKVTYIGVPDEAREVTREARVAYLEGEAGALEGHKNLTRLKVMALLALMDGRAQATGWDWYIAGLIIDRSDMNMQRCQVALNEVRQIQAARDAEAQEERTIAREERKQNSARKWALNKLRQFAEHDQAAGVDPPGWRRDNGAGGLLSLANSAQRDTVADVLPALVEEGLILLEQRTGSRGESQSWYRIAEQST